MKRILLISALLLFAVGLNAQRSGSTNVLSSTQYYKTLTMTTADTVHTTSYWVFTLNKMPVQYFSFAVGVDTATLTTAGHIYFTVWGSVDGATYVNTGATTVKVGGTVDTTFALSDVSTGVLWRYLKLQAVNQNTDRRAHRVSAISLKIGEK